MSLYPQMNEYLKLFPDAAIPEKYLIGKSGSVFNNVALIASTNDEPAYIIMDSTLMNSGLAAGLSVTGSSTDLGIPLTCKRLGQGGKTAWAHASGAIADGDDIISDGAGQVASLQTYISAGTHGTYWKIGYAVNDTCVGGAIGSSDGIEFVDIEPSQVTI
jgi:hypothetical protein